MRIRTKLAVNSGAAAALALTCLAGCGQKGPLYLPDATRQAVLPAPAADASHDPDKDKDKNQQQDSAPTPATAPPASTPPAPAG